MTVATKKLFKERDLGPWVMQQTTLQSHSAVRGKLSEVKRYRDDKAFDMDALALQSIRSLLYK